MSFTLCLFRTSGQKRIAKSQLEAIENQRLGHLARTIEPAKFRERLQRPLRRADDATITSVETSSAMIEGNIEYTRVASVFGDEYEIPTEYKVWFRKNSNLLAVQGSSYTLAEALGAVFLYGLTENAITLERIEVTNREVKRIAKWLGAKSHKQSGAITRVRFHDAIVGGEGPFGDISIADNSLLESATLRELLEGEATFHSMSALAPIVEGVSRQVAFTVNSRAVSRITSDCSVQEANRLLDELEGLIVS